jgi:amino acid transporter
MNEEYKIGQKNEWEGEWVHGGISINFDMLILIAENSMQHDVMSTYCNSATVLSLTVVILARVLIKKKKETFLVLRV